MQKAEKNSLKKEKSRAGVVFQYECGHRHNSNNRFFINPFAKKIYIVGQCPRCRKASAAVSWPLLKIK
ncbi:MAG: hypothetical protein Q4F21_11685 [Lachnospiraceae bacterium]|nr:hypothetical protein [Lachnospiraceae bacterium]